MTPLTPFDLALHIGAGADADASPDLARRFVFVEPDPEAAAALRARTADAAAEVLEAAVAGEGTADTLHVFNAPGYASLRRPTGLRRLFPGLETAREVAVETLTPAALLAGLDMADDARVLLIVDAPGEERAILEGLLDARDPSAFAEIRFRCGEIALYEGSDDAEAVCALLRRAGFAVGAPEIADDPDRPLRVARPDHAAALAKLKAELADARHALAERDEALKAAEAGQATVAADLAKAREALAARDKTLAEREAALKAAEARQSAGDAELAKARETLAARDKALAEREEALKAAQARQSAADAELAKARETLAARDKALAEREEALKAAQARQSAGDADLAKARETLAARDKALAERDEALKAAEARQSAADAELAKARETLAARDKALAERDEALKAAEAGRATAAADLAKAREALAARDKALAERDEALKGRESALSKAQGRIGDLTETNRRMEIDLRTMRRDLGLALRMQATLQAALDDLRERHAQISVAKEKQDDLLQQLTPRLREAALQLQALPAGSAADQTALSGSELSRKTAQ